MSIYKASFYNFFFNSFNSVLIIVNGIVMVPIYFHYMSVSTYGAWLATGNVVAMLSLLESGFAGVITQKMSVAIAQKNDCDFQKLAGANIISAICIASAILIVGLAISPFITDWVNVESDVAGKIRIAFIISLIASCIHILVSLYGAFPQVWQDTKSVGIYNTIANVSAIVSLIAFLLCGFGVVSIALSYLVRALLNFILYVQWIVRKWIREIYPKPIYSIHNAVILSKDCFYPFLSKLSATLVGNSQSFIIAHFMSPTLAAVYDLTSKVCLVACGFVSQLNGSFFALFSLTLAEGNKAKTEKVFYNASMFLVVILAVTVLYSMCFTEPIMHYWVGLDKFGGTKLLVVIVVAKVLSQLRGYLNNVLYTGGMINKSSKLDIAWMVLYLLLLLVVVKPIQVYAVPVATLISSLVFIVLYLRLIKKNLDLNVKSFASLMAEAILLIVPMFIAHLYMAPDYQNLMLYSLYFVAFSLVFWGLLYIMNKSFFLQLSHRIRKKS